jgi:hypothetical protein
MMRAITAEGKAEGRVSGNNSWPINELQIGDVYVADGFGKIVEGTLIGSTSATASPLTPTLALYSMRAFATPQKTAKSPTSTASIAAMIHPHGPR